ncbi:MAG TPA: glycosyltransferase [Vicinamibacterales bacterium]|nr:glycosyltransferase [Vicinamibacterales bacterium]
MPSRADRRALRVAYLIDSDGPGGAERVVADLAKSFHASEGRCVVFLPAEREGWLGRELADSGVTVEPFRWGRAVSPAWMRSFVDAFRRHDITVAHSHDFYMAVYGACASRIAGIPHVITMHGGRYYAARFQRRIAMRSAIALSAATIAVSRQLGDQMSRDLWVRRSGIDMVSNGVRYQPADGGAVRRELGLAPGDRLAVSIGNLYPVKGHRYLVDALARLADRHPTLHVAVCGRGDLAAVLASRARALGVGGRVHLLGLRSDVSAVLAASDLFVLPSLSEGLPLALLEAMFAGCPIVATDVGEVSAALANGEAGVIVRPGDASDLASALDALLGDPDRARMLGARARGRAASEYDRSQMVQRYRSIYEQVLSGASSRAAGLFAPSAQPNL